MKNFRSYLTFLFPFSLILLMAMDCAPSKQYAVQGTNTATGMDGEVTLSVKKTGNQELEIELEHLLPPKRIDGVLERYMVWIIPSNGDPVPEGFLSYDETSRTGEATVKTPFQTFKLVITAEYLQEPSAPSKHVIIERHMDVNNI